MTAQQQAALIALLQTPAYTGLTDAAAATLASTPAYAPVPYTTFQPAVMQLSAWGAVRLAATNLASFAASPPVQAAILTAIDLFTAYKAPTVDLSLAAFQAALTGLVQAGIVSSSDATAILALGQVLPIGVTVAAGDVTTARAIMAQQSAAAALIAKIEAGTSAAIALVNTYANGATSGTAPTGTQLQQAFAAQVGS